MIDEFLAKLHADGVGNDSAVDRREEMMLNITPSTGRFLDVLITDSRPHRILELGTSNGYSTIWIARSARSVNATVDSVDISARKTQAAARNLHSVGHRDAVSLHTCDGGQFLSDCDTDRYDFVFLDSARSEYVDWLSDLIRVVRLGTVVVDNAISHAGELQPFFYRVQQNPKLANCVLPIGKGQMVIRKGYGEHK